MRTLHPILVAALGTFVSVACGDEDAPQIEVAWTLVGADGTSRLSCEQAGVDDMNLHVHNGPQVEVSTRIFTHLPACAAGQATLGSLEPGTFWVTLLFINQQGRIVMSTTTGPHVLAKGQRLKLPTMNVMSSG